MRPNRKALKAAKFDIFANHVKKTKVRKRQARVELAAPKAYFPAAQGERRKHVLDFVERPEKLSKAEEVDLFGIMSYTMW